MYEIELDNVKAIKQKFCEELETPADEQEIERLSEEFYKICKFDVPQAYLELLRQCNGVEFNGCIVYGSREIIDIQLDYDFVADEYFVFAEYDMGLFCMEKSSGTCCELDKCSAQEVQDFDTLEEMIKHVLSLSVRL